ncbi:MAG TPA: tetratricopeptide repeat protein, partial [Prolixibacteraceae bacterium]|nr:tetratricopeptide repeat protein [Prolixibacteraceae bacterium]
DPLYELNNTPIERRSTLFDSVNDIVKKRDDSFVREIIVLNLAGQPEKSVEYLSNSVFHFREGSSRVRDITVDAHLLLGQKYMEQKQYKQALEQFLSSVETTETTKPGKYTGDPRSAQINYFIGLAYEAMGNKAKAKDYYSRSTQEPLREGDYLNYYQGMSYQKLGQKDKAVNCFNQLISEGEKKQKQGDEVDFFAKFGEKESANVQQSNAWLLKGLGYKGLCDSAKAQESLRKSVELSASNLWAKVELGK